MAFGRSVALSVVVGSISISTPSQGVVPCFGLRMKGTPILINGETLENKIDPRTDVARFLQGGLLPDDLKWISEDRKVKKDWESFFEKETQPWTDQAMTVLRESIVDGALPNLLLAQHGRWDQIAVSPVLEAIRDSQGDWDCLRPFTLVKEFLAVDPSLRQFLTNETGSWNMWKEIEGFAPDAETLFSFLSAPEKPVERTALVRNLANLRWISEDRDLASLWLRLFGIDSIWVEQSWTDDALMVLRDSILDGTLPKLLLPQHASHDQIHPTPVLMAIWKSDSWHDRETILEPFVLVKEFLDTNVFPKDESARLELLATMGDLRWISDKWGVSTYHSWKDFIENRGVGPEPLDDVLGYEWDHPWKNEAMTKLRESIIDGTLPTAFSEQNITEIQRIRRVVLA
jgi:hypothetical protein